MNVTPRIIDLALLQLFKTPDDDLSFFDLGDRWFTTGLRSADLREALHRLCEAGYLACQSSVGLTSFRLSAPATSDSTARDKQVAPATIEEQALLLKLRKRHRSGYRPDLGRRVDDRTHWQGIGTPDAYHLTLSDS